MINPHLRWHKGQCLRTYPYTPDLDKIPKAPGVYMFYRMYGKNHQVFYVGKALNLRTRLKGQLNNLKLMNSIKSAARGARMLSYAEVMLKPGQKSNSAIVAAEKLLIRHFVEEGHVLFNVQGVKLRVQTLTNERPQDLRLVIPKRTQIEA